MAGREALVDYCMPEGLDDDSPEPGPWRVSAGPTIRIAQPEERRCKPERTRRLMPALAREFYREMAGPSIEQTEDAVLDRMLREARAMAWAQSLRSRP